MTVLASFKITDGRVRESWVRHDPDVMLYQMCHELGVSVWRVRSRSRDRKLVMVRRDIAHRLREAGHSFPAIGKALNRDHTSIMHLLGKTKRPLPNYIVPTTVVS